MMTNEILVATATVQTTIDGQEVRLVAGRTTVRAGHPILEGREDLFAPLVPTYETESEHEPADDAEPVELEGTGDEPGPAETVGYDPGEYTVQDVNAYLADADPGERERVLQAEAEGHARKGILSGPQSDLSDLD